MKYYLIAGEASGDLHASCLMRAIQQEDRNAKFRYFGGDCMKQVGGTLVQHYKQIAYMGFIPVLLHFRVLLQNLSFCKKDILDWKPDVVILVDYPGFNLKIARFVHLSTDIPVYYYILPKIWAWKEHRIKSIKQYVNQLFSILPFEIPYYEEKHHHPIHYVGNPTLDEVITFKACYQETVDTFKQRNQLSSLPIVAILAGSRQQEIKDNLRAMVGVASLHPDMQFVIAGVTSIDPSCYETVISNTSVRIIYGQTYELLQHAHAALVTSGTATLEAALFHVPQVVCYGLHYPSFILEIIRRMIHVKHVSLVNLIAGQEVVKELLGKDLTTANINRELSSILHNKNYREKMFSGYTFVFKELGEPGAPQRAARLITHLLQGNA